MWRRVASVASALLILAAPGALRLGAQENIPEVVRPILEEAERHRQAGRIEEAVARYREVIKFVPQFIAAYLSLGALYHQQGKLDEAIEVYAAGVSHAPSDNLLLFNAAAVDLQRGRVQEALSYLDRGIASHPSDPSLHFLRGTALRRLDRLDQAMEAFGTVVRLNPQDARAHLSLGNAYHQLGRKQDALGAYREAIRRDRTLIAAYYNLGAVLFELGNQDEALKAYDVGLAPVEKDLAEGRPVESTHAQAYLNLGVIHLQKQNWARALDAYQKALRLDPGQPAAHYNIGYVHYRQERFDEAHAAYERAVALDPSVASLAYLHLGLIDYRQGKIDAASRWLTDGLSRFDPDARATALLTLAAIALRNGDRPAARQRYQQVVDQRPNDVAALTGLGRLLREEGQLGEARGLLVRARALAPNASAVVLELAAIARVEGDAAGEKALYLELLKQYGDRPEVWWPVHVNLVGLLVRESAFSEARQAMERVMTSGAVPPDVSTLLHATYGILLAREGETRAAMREFQAALRADPAYSPALLGVAVLNALSNDLGESTASLAGLISRDDKALRELATANLGQALWLMGRLDEAAPHLRGAADAFPDYASLHVALGEIALADQNYAQATERLTRAVDLCGRAGDSVSNAPPSGSGRAVLQVVLGGRTSGTQPLCDRARRALGASLTVTAAETIGRGVQGVGAPSLLREGRDLVERALRLPLDSATQAVALVLRGTLSLLANQPGPAAEDLRRALAAALPEPVRGLARNNLGVALYRSGAVAEAQREFEAARRAKPPATEATLNLAIASHDRGDGQRALSLYEEYVTTGGSRREEVRDWIEALRRIYR